MIYPVSFTQNKDKKTQTSILYMNDFHAKLPNLERLYTASQAFDSYETSADKLKLSSGDDGLGEDLKINKAVSKLLNMIGIQKRQPGNHEFDVTPSIRAEIAEGATYQNLGGVNMHIRPGSAMSSLLVNSAIQEVNGHKYGILGVGPSDMDLHLKAGETKSDITVDNIDKTIENLNEERLKAIIEFCEKKGLSVYDLSIPMKDGLIDIDEKLAELTKKVLETKRNEDIQQPGPSVEESNENAIKVLEETFKKTK